MQMIGSANDYLTGVSHTLSVGMRNQAGIYAFT